MNAMRTTIYVDRFNLYYGCLRNTKYRWLNLEKLFRNILQDDHKIEKIHYFTAKLKSLSHDSTTLDRQKAYLNALRTLPAVKIHYGHFAIHQKLMPKAEPPHETVEVIKAEEKGTDVNLSVHLLNDAWLNKYDCAIFVTNNSDMTEALKLVKHHFPEKQIGLIPHEVYLKDTPMNLKKMLILQKILNQNIYVNHNFRILFIRLMGNAITNRKASGALSLRALPFDIFH